MSEQNNVEESTETESITQLPTRKYVRNDDGLIEGVNYVFNDDGSVNWRAMIKPEFLYPNKDWFDLRKQSVPTSIEGLEDKQLLIMLGGIKELAKLRGFYSVRYEVNSPRENYVIAKCIINWTPNYETSGDFAVFEDVANATLANTDDFCSKFLETIACNRAFVRCVRNFLNIHIVGADEIDKSKNRAIEIPDVPVVSNALPITAQGTLEKAVNEKLKINDFESFKVFLRSLWKKAQDNNDEEMLSLLQSAKDWQNFKDISAKTARVLLKVINEAPKDN
jgi:hypothetical protein